MEKDYRILGLENVPFFLLCENIFSPFSARFGGERSADRRIIPFLKPFTNW